MRAAADCASSPEANNPYNADPGARQRCVPRTFALQDTFHLAQLGILWKDDAFEVVLDPGSDEVEKQCLGPVPAHRGNTGCRLTRRCSLREKVVRPVKRPLTKLVYCTCGVSAGQFSLPRCHLIPARKGRRRRNSHGRRDHHQMRGWQVGQGIDLLAASGAQHRSPTRNNGRSLPTSAAMRNSSSAVSLMPRARSRPNIVATALDDAAPRPPCTGRRLSI